MCLDPLSCVLQLRNLPFSAILSEFFPNLCEVPLIAICSHRKRPKSFIPLERAKKIIQEAMIFSSICAFVVEKLAFEKLGVYLVRKTPNIPVSLRGAGGYTPNILRHKGKRRYVWAYRAKERPFLLRQRLLNIFLLPYTFVYLRYMLVYFSSMTLYLFYTCLLGVCGIVYPSPRGNTNVFNWFCLPEAGVLVSIRLREGVYGIFGSGKHGICLWLYVLHGYMRMWHVIVRYSTSKSMRRVGGRSKVGCGWEKRGKRCVLEKEGVKRGLLFKNSFLLFLSIICYTHSISLSSFPCHPFHLLTRRVLLTLSFWIFLSPPIPFPTNFFDTNLLYQPSHHHFVLLCA